MASPRAVSSVAKKKSLLDSIKKDLGILRSPKGRAQERRRTELAHRGLRWAIQLVFFAAFPGVWSAAFTGVRNVCQQLGAASPLELSSFVALLLALLAYTSLFGRFFCGYACTFGTFGDVVYAVATPLRHALGLDGKKLPMAVRRAFQLVKYAALAVIAWLCFAGLWSGVSGYSPWGAFAGLRAGSIEGISGVAFVVLALIALGMAFEERFFCQFLCPFGAVFSLLPVLPVSLFRRNRPTCVTRCNRCQDRCSVAIHPDRGDLRGGECIECGRCADGCPVSNVSLVRIEKAVAERSTVADPNGGGAPVAKNPAAPRPGRPAEPRFCIRGTEVTLVLLKAGILVALCYAFA